MLERQYNGTRISFIGYYMLISVAIALCDFVVK